jgi:integrase
LESFGRRRVSFSHSKFKPARRRPCCGVRIPKGKKHGRKRLAYSLDEILKHLEVFSQEGPLVIPKALPRKRRAGLGRRKKIGDGNHRPVIGASVIRAIIGVTGFAGLRRGEIRGLWWDDDRENILAVCRCVWRTTLKNTKTEEDIDEPGYVPIIQPLRLLLDAIKPEHAAGFIFPNRVGGALTSTISRTVSSSPYLKRMAWSGRDGMPIVAVSQRTSRNWEWKTPRSSAF